MKIAVLGLGNMGTAIGHLIAGNGHEVIGWEHFEEVVEEVNESHTNPRYLKDVSLHENLRATSDLEEAVKDCTCILFALPSQYLQDAAKKLKDISLPQATLLVSLSKGLINKKTSGQMLEDMFPDLTLVVLSGPSIAGEFARGEITSVTLASKEQKSLNKIAELLKTENFRVQFSEDRLGTELGGILKNCYALVLGLTNACQPDASNLWGAVTAVAISEMADLGESLGGKKETFYGNAGLGDLITSTKSSEGHHFRFTQYLVKEGDKEKAIDKLGQKPEGMVSLNEIRALAREHNCKTPLLDLVSEVLSGAKNAGDFTKELSGKIF